MIKCIWLFHAILLFADAQVISDVLEWQAFKKEHSKHYDSMAADLHHFRIFVDHKYKIEEHNQHFENGIVSFKMGLNKYSDMKHEDFVARMNGHNRKFDKDQDYGSVEFFTGSVNATLPKFVDWRQKGAVTPVKNQGQCGSCWSFASTGALESQHFIKTGHLISLSEQYLIDCTQLNGNFGCDGGWAMNSYQYIREHGIATENSYPYNYWTYGYCKPYSNNSGVVVRAVGKIPPGNEHKLQEAIATVGPIAVTIDASQYSFHFYKSGIYYDPQCSSTLLDHEVTVVGYGTDEYHRDYYILKNSWGESWGEKGYFRMSRNHFNHCGIATNAVYPIV